MPILTITDFFIFQYPADYPTVTITIRSKKGIHFIDKERVKLFGDRKTANLNLVSKLIERFPASIDKNVFYEPTFEDILSNRRISLIGLTSNAVTSLYRPNFSSLLDWNNNTPVPFILPNDFDKYFAYCTNFQGIRKQLKESSIKMKLKINQFARLEIVDFETSIQLTAKQTDRLKEIVSQIPLWTVDKEIDGIVINLKLD